MLVFLGLDAKPTEVPWMSFLILIFTCCYSILCIEKIEVDAASFSRRPEFQEAIRLRESLATMHCSLHEMSAAQCVKLSSLAKAKILFETDNILKFYQNGELIPNDPIKVFFDLLTYGGREENRKDLSNEQYAKTFAHYTYIKNQTYDTYKEFLRQHNLLSKTSMNPISLIRANFLNGAWLQLICNMLFFIVFSIFVECRLGAMLTLTLYLVGGTVGLFLQTKFFLDPTTYILGSSACVCSILGASLALFTRKKIKLLMSFIVYNRVFLVPAMVAIPLMTLLLDLVDGFDINTNLGHVAHLSSFCCGFLMAQFFGAIDIVPKEFLFPEEYRLFKIFKKSTEFRVQLRALKKLLAINSENIYVLEQATEWFTKELLKHPAFFKNHLLFISETIGIAIREKLREEPPAEVGLYMSQLPASLNYPLVFKYVPISLRMRVQDHWLKRRRFSLSIADNLEIEDRISKKESSEQWIKIVSSLEVEGTRISERERDEIILIYESKMSKLREHPHLKLIEDQIRLLKERSYVQTA